MSHSLEHRYRRLLAWYPQAHRDAYEEEMVAVLMDDARPSQRRPGFAESFDLVVSAVRARIGSEGHGLTDIRWRRAAGVVGVLLALLLALKNLRPIVSSLVTQVQTGDPWLTTVAPTTWTLAAVWTATAVVALLGLRRTARVAVGIALATEVVLLVTVYHGHLIDALYSVWTLVAALTAAAGLIVSDSLDRRFLRGRAGRAFGLAALLTLAAFVVSPLILLTVGGPDDGIGTVQVYYYLASVPSSDLVARLSLYGLPALVLAVLAGVAATVGVLCLDAPVRRRLVAMLVPPAVLIVVIDQFYAAYAFSSPQFDPSALVATVQWIGLALIPLVTFALAVALVHRRERTIDRLELGRQARRSAAAPPDPDSAA